MCSTASRQGSVDKALARKAIGDTLKAIHHGARQVNQRSLRPRRSVFLGPSGSTDDVVCKASSSFQTRHSERQNLYRMFYFEPRWRSIPQVACTCQTTSQPLPTLYSAGETFGARSAAAAPPPRRVVFSRVDQTLHRMCPDGNFSAALDPEPNVAANSVPDGDLQKIIGWNL